MKKIMFWLLLIMDFSYLYGDDIVYTVIQETALYDRGWGGGLIRNLFQGEEVYYAGNMSSQDFKNYEILIETKQNAKGWVDTESVILQNNQSLPKYFVAKKWVYSFYQDMLVAQDRKILFKYEPFWRDDYREVADRDFQMMFTEWWEWFYPTCFDIRNNAMRVSGLLIGDSIDFVYTSQQQENKVLLIKVMCLRKRNDFPQNYLNKLFNEGEEYTLIFKIDGDYMDFYVGSEENKVCTLIGVDDQFIEAIMDIVGDEQVDLTNVVWPRRADGSMDYPPPQPTQAAVTEQPETADITDYGEAAGPGPVEETVGRQTAAGFPWVIIVVIAGIALVGATAFVVLRKKK
jgi:hypothetical protein